MGFECDFESFEYFTKNCKTNLSVWLIKSLKPENEEYFTYVEQYNNQHNCLKVLGLNACQKEVTLADSLKNQGVTVDTINRLYGTINWKNHWI